MAEMKTLNGHEIVDEKARLTRAVYYDSVAEMTTDETLTAGMSAVTKGYYKANDGGAATYTIRESADGDVIDGGLLHSLSNGLVAEMILPDEIVIESFGAVGDKTTDDTDKFEKALATGRPVRGTDGHFYHVEDIVLWNGKISNCYFYCKESRGNDAIILRSHAILDNCRFTNFRNAVKKIEGYSTVFARIRDCTFDYNFNGLYFDLEGDESVNQLILENNYFAYNGVGAGDYSTSYSEDGGGYGAYFGGNFCNVVARGNVFEYNTFCGLALVNTSTNYIVSADVVGNYFEGNKNSAIYINLSYQNNLIHIDANYYSNMETNIHYTKYINYFKGMSVYNMRDVNPIMASAYYGTTNLLDVSHKIVFDSSMPSTYFNMVYANSRYPYKTVPLTSGDEYRTGVRMVYTSVIKSEIILYANSVDYQHNFDLGTTETIIPVTDSWHLSRALVEGESITIHYIGE